MSRPSRAPFVALTTLVHLQHPDLPSAEAAITAGIVLVDGRVIDNRRARVRRDASVRILAPRQLRGRAKLASALDAFDLDVSGAVVADIGAAAGGFTTALLERGARRIYAVDVGGGQLVGRLRADPRVVNLERTNVADLDRSRVPEPLDAVTMDLSYLPVSEAVTSLSALHYVRHAVLVALVKPTFELRAGSLVVEGSAVRRAIARATEAVDAAGWETRAATLPAVTGARGAVEAFILARRTHAR